MAGTWEAATTQRPRIVLVDDAADLRTLMRITLERDGMEVVGEGGDGQAAIDLAGRLHPDVLVLDLAMPVMDGLEALPGVLAASPTTAVVVVSGFDDTLGPAAVAAGAAGYICKDAQLAELGKRLRALLHAA
ncbi:MAG TPA: response regulator [Acidimicrobiales bacterium]|nr:response regulator [Acidimicrobiales bacterium]